MGQTLSIYQVDAFASAPFTGNPAAVCVMDSWLDDKMMQQIAAENNLAETAFVVPYQAGYQIRWFTPAVEVALCGHATLATAYVLFTTKHQDDYSLVFYSQERGTLTVDREEDWLVLDFPSDEPHPIKMPKGLGEVIGKEPLECYMGTTDYLLIYKDQRTIDALDPKHFLLRDYKVRGIIVSAPGDEVDFVSRFFAPGSGIDEDPVTGSAHTILIPYWSKRLGKKSLLAQQRSARKGMLRCEDHGPRVRIGGQAALYMKGEIYIP